MYNVLLLLYSWKLFFLWDLWLILAFKLATLFTDLNLGEHMKTSYCSLSPTAKISENKFHTKISSYMVGVPLMYCMYIYSCAADLTEQWCGGGMEAIQTIIWRYTPLPWECVSIHVRVWSRLVFVAEMTHFVSLCAKRAYQTVVIIIIKSILAVIQY